MVPTAVEPSCEVHTKQFARDVDEHSTCLLWRLFSQSHAFAYVLEFVAAGPHDSRNGSNTNGVCSAEGVAYMDAKPWRPLQFR